MNASSRIWLAAGIVGVAAAVQTGLIVHMMTGPASSYEDLRKPLAELPLEFYDSRGGTPVLTWRFKKEGLEAKVLETLPFKPKDILFRRDDGSDSSVQLVTYIVHTGNSEDREHHPEICVRDVQQFPEDVSVKAIVNLANDESKPVQRLCFKSGPGQELTIYYWHYTYLPQANSDQTWLQAVHQTISRKPPSVTVQVTTTAGRERWNDIEQVLLPALDRAMRVEHLPASVRMGCDRLPIALETR